MARAILLAVSLQATAASTLFFAKLLPLESHGPTGWVAVAVTRKGLVGTGMAKGLEAKLLASPLGANCTAANGCGTHVHSGTACTNSSTQGGHYFDANTTDPWSSVGYTFTTRQGRAVFKFALKTTARDVAQKPFIIHDNAGARVACGLLVPVFSGRLPKRATQLLNAKQLPSVEDVEDDDFQGGLDELEDELDDMHGRLDENEGGESNKKYDRNGGRDDKHEKHGHENVAPISSVYVAKLMPLQANGPEGWVAVAVTRTGLLGAGMAKGLEVNLRASPKGANCTAPNGCGAHVHSGTGCNNTSTQGGHYFDANATDPWAAVGYPFTTRRGRTLFKFSIETMAQDISQKPFIIHNNAGGRVACGLLAPVAPGTLPKHAGQLLSMKKLPTVEDVEEDEQGHEEELDDADGDEEGEEDGEDGEDDEDQEENEGTEDGDNDDKDEHEHNGRHLAATPILI